MQLVAQLAGDTAAKAFAFGAALCLQVCDARLRRSDNSTWPFGLELATCLPTPEELPGDCDSCSWSVVASGGEMPKVR